MSTVIGIIGKILYIAPFYGGDHEHCIRISDFEKDDLIESGAPVLDSYESVEAFLYGMGLDEFRAMRLSQSIADDLRKLENQSKTTVVDYGLPF